MDKVTYIPYGVSLLSSNSIQHETHIFYNENTPLAMQSLRKALPNIAKADIAYLYFLTVQNHDNKKESNTLLYATWGILVFAVSKDREITSCEINDFDINSEKALNAISILAHNAVSPSTLKEVLDDSKT